AGTAPADRGSLPLHDALPISAAAWRTMMTDASEKSRGWHLDRRVPITFIAAIVLQTGMFAYWVGQTTQRVLALEHSVESAENRRSEEHTSELQSRENLVCRLL